MSSKQREYQAISSSRAYILYSLSSIRKDLFVQKYCDYCRAKGSCYHAAALQKQIAVQMKRSASSSKPSSSPPTRSRQATRASNASAESASAAKAYENEEEDTPVKKVGGRRMSKAPIESSQPTQPEEVIALDFILH